MIINGKEVKLSDCMERCNPADFVWVAYDDSKARLPVAVAPTAVDLAKMMGVSRNSVESTWCSYKNGRLKTAKYAKVYIGDDVCE